MSRSIAVAEFHNNNAYYTGYYKESQKKNNSRSHCSTAAMIIVTMTMNAMMLNRAGRWSPCWMYLMVFPPFKIIDMHIIKTFL